MYIKNFYVSNRMRSGDDSTSTIMTNESLLKLLESLYIRYTVSSGARDNLGMLVFGLSRPAMLPKSWTFALQNELPYGT